MLLSRNRLFERKPATREARSIYIFCEGKRREKNYFDYFREMDSRINVEVYELNGEEDNSPLGLLEIAKRSIIESEVNPNPSYTFQENDEVWIVLDTDPDQQESRKEQIDTVRREISKLDAWFVTESNPCFEVWLYYHFHEKVEPFGSSDICKTWKVMVNKSISGGFDSRKHPLYVERATTNAEVNFKANESGKLSVGSTEVFRLSKSFLPLILKKIKEVQVRLGL
ncbi:RloB family protein [Aquiflexum sp.]|uniref:RloB family protein n=1 Tax=Aquiflexum sp. TaxID=1872584 RepID=UPI003593A2F2